MRNGVDSHPGKMSTHRGKEIHNENPDFGCKTSSNCTAGVWGRLRQRQGEAVPRCGAGMLREACLRVNQSLAVAFPEYRAYSRLVNAWLILIPSRCQVRPSCVGLPMPAPLIMSAVLSSPPVLDKRYRPPGYCSKRPAFLKTARHVGLWGIRLPPCWRWRQSPPPQEQYWDYSGCSG